MMLKVILPPNLTVVCFACFVYLFYFVGIVHFVFEAKNNQNIKFNLIKPF